MAVQALEGIMIVEDFLDPDRCQLLVDYAARQAPIPLGVVDHGRTNTRKVASTVNRKARDSQKIPIDGIKTMLESLFVNVFTEHVEPFYQERIEWWEQPQLLRYVTGGRYGAHADGGRWVKQEDGTITWHRSLDRDISVLLYLNDAFTGGALRFPKLNFSLQPRPGLLVAFPSTGQYLHGALPTESGVRYALVSWAAWIGTPRVREKPPYGAIFMKEARAALLKASLIRNLDGYL